MSNNKPDDNKISGIWYLVSGIWWLSSNPDKQVTGELLIDNRKLELSGTFVEIKSRTFGGNTASIVHVNQDKTILGMSKRGKQYMLDSYHKKRKAWD